MASDPNTQSNLDAQIREKIIELAEELKINANAELDLDPKKAAEIREEVLYFAFEGCRNGWYPAKDKKLEMKMFRHMLMQEMLKNRGWNAGDIAYNLNAPNSLNNLTDDGWFCSTQKETMSNSDDRLNQSESITRYTSLDGVEFDYKNAKINIFATEHTAESSSPCLFTNIDLVELIFMGELQGGPSLSLGSVDSSKPNQPFQRITFAPSYMYGSRLMRCLFLCDYMLKWMVTGSEIQFRPDQKNGELFETKSINDNFMKDFPNELTNLISEFRDMWNSAGNRRVWFEPERVKIFQGFDPDTNKETYDFGDVRMLFKQQKLEFDSNGVQIDSNVEDKEGWPCYVYDQRNYDQLQPRSFHNKHDEKAFIVIPKHSTLNKISTYKCIFWEYDNSNPSNQMSFHEKASFEVSGDDELVPLLCRLCKLNETNEKIQLKSFKPSCVEEDDKADKISEIIELTYRILLIACKRANQEHGFSDPFRFSFAMTDSYDLLAKHVPEFARLKELSKIVSLVKLMATRRFELKTEAQNVESKKGLIKWAVTSSDELKRAKAFEKALKEIKFGTLKDDDFPTEEQEKKRGVCYWVPAVLYDSTIPNNAQFRGVYGGGTMKREGKRHPNKIQGDAAEVYHYRTQLSNRSNLFVFPQCPIKTPKQLRYNDFLTFDANKLFPKHMQNKNNDLKGVISAIEIKSGNSLYKEAQRIADDWQKTNLNFEAELHRYRDRNVFMEFYGQKMTARKYELTPGKYLMMPVGFQ